MVADEQTHTLPEDEEGLARGRRAWPAIDDVAAFAAALTTTLGNGRATTTRSSSRRRRR